MSGLMGIELHRQSAGDAARRNRSVVPQRSFMRIADTAVQLRLRQVLPTALEIDFIHGVKLSLGVDAIFAD